MAENNNKSWWESPKAIFGSFFWGIGVGDMIGRFSPIIGLGLDIILIILGSLLFLTAYLSKRKEPEINQVIKVVGTTNANVIKIVTPEKPNRLPVYFDIIIYALCFATLCMGAYQLRVWVTDKAIFKPLGLTLFSISYFVAPIVVSIDFLFIQRKHRKEGKSEVYAETFIDYKADNIEVVFQECNKILDIMKAEPPSQYGINNSPQIIRRLIKSTYFTVEISKINDNLFKIHAASDANRVEIRYDWGRNQRNIDTFKRLILKG